MTCRNDSPHLARSALIIIDSSNSDGAPKCCRRNLIWLIKKQFKVSRCGTVDRGAVSWWRSSTDARTSSLRDDDYMKTLQGKVRGFGGKLNSISQIDCMKNFWMNQLISANRFNSVATRCRCSHDRTFQHIASGKFWANRILKTLPVTYTPTSSQSTSEAFPTIKLLAAQLPHRQKRLRRNHKSP